MAPSDLFGRLNEQQRRAATHGDGPLLIIAGAGTGKTTTLAARVAHLLDQQVSPERILLLTFTRRAAAEMLGRAARAAGDEKTRRIWSGTFHAMGNRLLRTFGRELGLDAGFSILDQEDSADLIDLIRAELGFASGRQRRFPRKGRILSIYSRVVNSGETLEETVARFDPEYIHEVPDIGRILQEYIRRKRARFLLDYDDLLVYWQALLQNGAVARRVAERFEHILVDEYQDTNRLQAAILLAMRPEGTARNITAVGDDAQSIYAFRAATIRNILDFPEHFPGCTLVTLEENYRSTQPILQVSNAVIAQASERYRKELFTRREGGEKPLLFSVMDDRGQCDAVCRLVLELREQNVALREQAVLFRAGWHSNELEVELQRRNIPFVKYGGLRFLESAHIKDLIALMRLVSNAHDELAWFRILQYFPGIGPATARRVSPALGEIAAGGSERTALPAMEVPGLPPARRADIQKLLSVLLAIRELGGAAAPAVDVVRLLRRFYDPLCRQVHDNSEMRLRDLDQLESLATRSTDCSSFVSDLVLDPPSSTSDLAGPPLIDEDYLILSTVHSAKGCEWDAVHVIHAADGMFPSDMACGSSEEIEEERRLFYVALTRARDHLAVYFPRRYYWRPWGASDRHGLGQLTRFITREVEALMKSELADPQATAADQAALESASEGLEKELKELMAHFGRTED